MIKKKKTTTRKAIRVFRKSEIQTSVTKKACGSWRRPQTKAEKEAQAARQAKYKQDCEDKRSELSSKYGEPEIVDNRAYWFKWGYMLDGLTIKSLYIKQKYIIFGEELVYIVGNNYPESNEVQLAYKWHKAEQELLNG